MPKLPPNMSKRTIPTICNKTHKYTMSMGYTRHGVVEITKLPMYNWNIIKRLNELYEMDGLCKTYNNPSIPPPPIIRSPHIYSHSITYFHDPSITNNKCHTKRAYFIGDEGSHSVWAWGSPKMFDLTFCYIHSMWMSIHILHGVCVTVIVHSM